MFITRTVKNVVNLFISLFFVFSRTTDTLTGLIKNFDRILLLRITSQALIFFTFLITVSIVVDQKSYHQKTAKGAASTIVWNHGFYTHFFKQNG